MTRSLLRRFDDAFAAFLTGHSRRDRDLRRRRHMALRALRSACAMRAYVAASDCPPEAQAELDDMNARVLASAQSLEDQAYRVLVGLERDLEPLLLHQINIHPAARYARWRRELLDIEGVKVRAQRVPGAGEALRVTLTEGERDGDERLAQHGTFDFLQRQFCFVCRYRHRFHPFLWSLRMLFGWVPRIEERMGSPP